MSQQFDVAILGATGLVGQQILSRFWRESRLSNSKSYIHWPAAVRLVKAVQYLRVKILMLLMLILLIGLKHKLPFFSAGGARSKQYAPLAA